MASRDPLTVPECLALLRHTGRGKTAARNRGIIVVMWRAGLRVQETLDLRPRDVNLDTGEIRIHRGKGGKARTVVIDGDGLAVLELWIELRRGLEPPPRAPLFCTLAGRPIYQQYIRQLLPRLAARAGIDRHVHPHTLRHTFAYGLSRDGVAMPTIQGALGHANLRTTDTYLNHLTPRELAAAIHGRPAWAPAPGTDPPRPGPRSVATRSGTNGTPPAAPARTQPPRDGPALSGSLLALARQPKARASPTR